ncbi:hypothetical protein HELRODRAFT_192523 [Helobdella robusta]|uniref:Uncharacterized protein n=1 Tax=Helobdella robusta TaxID=6412 RepID=T1FU19_HELRO|nr:hypothetical protein HELRODRAFT_192523 [Helobdella robusta]ESO00556.1 hypothetical protein HELRODRAFT_192523 [Helobdella robusta]
MSSIGTLFFMLLASLSFQRNSNPTAQSSNNNNNNNLSTQPTTMTSWSSSTTDQLTEADNITSYKCPITFADNVTGDILRQQFKMNTSGGIVYMVYFKLRYQNFDGNTAVFNISGPDTFAPDLWAWVAGKGKNLLRLPLDHKILSLGLLTIQSADMEVKFSYETYSCFKSIPYASTKHIIGKFISENVTSNGTSINADTEGPVICRSVYAFYHVFYGLKGVGFDCCMPGKVLYTCEQGYSDAFEIVWYGPIALMGLIYIIGIVHFYKLYKKNFNQVEVRKLSGLKKTVDEIKHDIVNRIVVNTEKWARIQCPEALIALRERCGILEVLGVGKSEHAKIISFCRIMFSIFLFLAYYGIWGIFLRVYYDLLKDVYPHFKDSETVFLNIIGHIGWVFCPKKLGIYSYAIFEVVYTAVVPFLALYIYLTIRAKKLIVDERSKKCCFKYLLFCDSTCGRGIQFLFIVLLLIHFVMLGGVFLTYVVYLVALGVFANIDVVSPWVIPITVCFHLFSTSFDPAYAKYKHFKDSLFCICFEEFKTLIIKQNKEIFLPRDLIEDFYIPNSRNLIYSCFLRIFWILTFMFLLVLVVLTLQYPYNTKLNSLVPFLGVQVVFVLPYLTKFMYVSQTSSPLEDTVLKRDLRDYISQYIKQRPELKDPHPENGSVTELLKSSSSDNLNDNNKNHMNEISEVNRDNDELEMNVNPNDFIAAANELKRHRVI